MFSPASAQFFFWLAAALCAVAQVAVIRAALAGRTPGASPSPVSQARELFWVLLPAAFLVLVLAWSWQALPGHSYETGAQRPGASGASLPAFKEKA